MKSTHIITLGRKGTHILIVNGQFIGNYQTADDMIQCAHNAIGINFNDFEFRLSSIPDYEYFIVWTIPSPTLDTGVCRDHQLPIATCQLAHDAS